MNAQQQQQQSPQPQDLQQQLEQLIHSDIQIDSETVSSIKLDNGGEPDNTLREAIVLMLRIEIFNKSDRQVSKSAAQASLPKLDDPALVDRRKKAKEFKKAATAVIRKFMVKHRNAVKYIAVGDRFIVLKSKHKIDDHCMNVFARVVDKKFKTPEFAGRFGQGMTADAYELFVKRMQLAFLNDVHSEDKPVYSIAIAKKLPSESVMDQLNAVFAALPTAPAQHQ